MKRDYRATKDDIALFRSWLSKQHHLPNDVEDHYIGSFIVGAKGSVERAKTVFDNYYKVQQTMPELFRDWDPLSVENERFNKLLCCVDLPKKTPENHIVCISRLIDLDPTHYSTMDLFVRFFVLIQIQLWENSLGNAEFEFVFDSTGLTFGHIKDITPVLAKKLMTCILYASPVRIKAIHMVNMPQVFEWAINMFKPLMTTKLRDRLHIHNSYESLREALPKEILPEEYGGDEVSITKLYDNYRERIVFYRERCRKQKTLREQELQFRPKKETPETCTGTFRKLTID